MDHDQRVTIKFFWNEEAGARDISARFQTQFGDDSCRLQTISFWIAKAWLACQDLHDDIPIGRPPPDDCDKKSPAILDKSLFESIYSISQRLLVACQTVLRHLHGSIGFKSFHFYWCPYLLTDNLREKRKEYARGILPLLQAAECDG
jgi:hypothetical protein